HYAVEYQVTCRDRRFHRIADHVVEVVVDQACALRESERMDEDNGVERLHPGEELLQFQARVGEVHAVDVGIDFHATQAESLDAALQLHDGEVDILQRHRAHRYKSVRPGRDDLREPIVDQA